MKKLIFTFCFTLLFAISSYSQWTEQTSGTTNPIYSVSAVDNDVVWACGEAGTVLRTINSGITWTVVTSPNPGIGLYTIAGLDAMTALVSGTSISTTFAYKTIDGGATWVQTFAQPGGFIDALTKFNGFPVCGLLGDPVGGRWTQFVSFDFGSTWDSTGFYNPAPPGEAGWNNSFFPATPSLFSYYGTNNTKLYQPFANGTILSYPTPGLLNSFAVWGNANNRLMTGGTIMLYTTDGGTTWTNVNAIGSGNILGICGAGSVWYYVRGSSVYKSIDDGATWSNDYSATGNYNHISLSPLGRYMWAVRDNGGISRNLFDPSLPVELSSFSSVVSGRDVTLSWSTVSEENNSGFEIERLDSRSGSVLNGEWSMVHFITGNGNSNTPQNYTYEDKNLLSGKYNYRLKQIDFNGNFKYHYLGNEVIVGMPEKFTLSQNYPNPFNPSTNINFDLPFDGNVSLIVYDMTGREVANLVNDFRAAGFYSVNFNASNLSSGVYLYRISADANGQNFSAEKRMMLVK